MNTHRLGPAAFSLVEVTLALGVAAFALVAIFGLLPVGLDSDQAATAQSAATNIGTEIVADLHEIPSATDIASASIASPTPSSALTAVSPKYKINASATTTTIYLDETGVLLAAAAQARYKAVISFTPPATGQRTATLGSVVISWPAATATPLGSVSLFVSLDRN